MISWEQAVAVRIKALFAEFVKKGGSIGRKRIRAQNKFQHNLRQTDVFLVGYTTVEL